jgi:hypothetical protein
MLSTMIKNLNNNDNNEADDSKNCTIIVNPHQVHFDEEENSGETEGVEGEDGSKSSGSDECATINDE